MTSPFGKNCPRKGCQAKVVRVTGDPEAEHCSVRCEDNHRSRAKRASNGRLTLTDDPDGESLALETEVEQ